MPRSIYLVFLVVILSSCKFYKQDILFRLDDDFTEEDLSSITDELDKNYILKPNDILQLNVFTNDGERLIDPNFEISALTGGQMGGQQMFLQRDIFTYTIQGDSTVTFPLLGDINLVGLTLYDAELLVAETFNRFYEDSFVKLRINNRRAFVLGTPGGRVVPLENENTGLIEVIALAGGVTRNGRAQKIRVVRGPSVYQVDLSTVSGLMATNMIVEPGDIIYVEPWRRPWLESIRDLAPILSIISSTITLTLVIQNL
ncbi:MAG: polysaccharide biosynthesis/export family protein [Bacteroidota bacterium]